MTKPQRLGWWRAYATVLAILGGLCLAHFAPLPFAWRIGAQVVILLAIYVELWRRARAARLPPVPRRRPQFPRGGLGSRRGGSRQKRGEVLRVSRHALGTTDRHQPR
jgi:hypothetical protein